jgi:hypothetical protein
MIKFKKIKSLILLGLISFSIVILQLSQVNAQEVDTSEFREDSVAEEVTQPSFDLSSTFFRRYFD